MKIWYSTNWIGLTSCQANRKAHYWDAETKTQSEGALLRIETVLYILICPWIEFGDVDLESSTEAVIWRYSLSAVFCATDWSKKNQIYLVREILNMYYNGRARPGLKGYSVMVFACSKLLGQNQRRAGELNRHQRFVRSMAKIDFNASFSGTNFGFSNPDWPPEYESSLYDPISWMGQFGRSAKKSKIPLAFDHPSLNSNRWVFIEMDNLQSGWSWSLPVWNPFVLPANRWAVSLASLVPYFSWV